MSTNDHAKHVRAYIDELCARMERGEKPERPRKAWWRVPAVLPVAVGLSLVACGGTVEESGSDDPGKEVCDNQKDDDGDGKLDCDDSDCADFPGCMTAAYGAPGEICDNEADDDGDGKVDCDDEDCSTSASCSMPPYGAPIEECDNNIDDDYDNKVDCDDEDCAGFPGCGGEDYAAPFESDCSNNFDDDGDGDTDCNDSDCHEDPNCVAVPAYAAPFSE